MWSLDNQVITAVMGSQLHDAGTAILDAIVEKLVSIGVPHDFRVFTTRRNVYVPLVEPDGTEL